jgi:hypothetical protein
MRRGSRAIRQAVARAGSPAQKPARPLRRRRWRSKGPRCSKGRRASLDPVSLFCRCSTPRCGRGELIVFQPSMQARTSKARGTRRSKITIVCVYIACCLLRLMRSFWISSQGTLCPIGQKSNRDRWLRTGDIVRRRRLARFTRCCLIHLSCHEARSGSHGQLLDRGVPAGRRFMIASSTDQDGQEVPLTTSGSASIFSTS